MRYLLLGSSLRGLAAAAHLAVSDGAEVVLFDTEHPGVPEGLGGPVTALGPTWSPDVLDGIDRVITSPWFGDRIPPISDAIDAGVPVVTEAGFGLEHVDTPRIAITGTNGKTTVTEATTAMLVGSGVAAVAAGNIGRPVSSIGPDDAEVLVLELSSYQLRFISALRASAMAILNIAPDHLDWHGSLDDYAAAKARVFSDALPDAVLAYNADDPIVVELVAGATGCVAVPCSGSTIPDGGNGVRYGALVINGVSHPATHIDETYRFDLVVAGTLAAALGATTEAIGDVVASFIPGPHRREMVASIAGVTFINDSKATNPHAALAAVAAYPSVILLAGGRNKGLDLAELANAAPLKALIAFGEARREIAELADRDVVEAETLSDAFAAAIAIATEGDTVLLAPGCASFDEFGSYEERGRAFRRLVEARRSAA